MHIVFYGVMRDIGTSANMAAVAAFMQFRGLPVSVCVSHLEEDVLHSEEGVSYSKEDVLHLEDSVLYSEESESYSKESESYSEIGISHMGVDLLHSEVDSVDSIVFTDCSKSGNVKQLIEDCDLLVCNLSGSFRELEDVYFRYSFVRKNVMFLFGKFFQGKVDEVRRFASCFRISGSRIFVIPYNPRFAFAYDRNRVLDYVMRIGEKGACDRDLELKRSLECIVKAMIALVNGKGVFFYG